MSNQTTIEEVLTTMWHAANLTPWDKDSMVDVVRPSVDEALATIKQLVLQRVIGEPILCDETCDDGVHSALARRYEEQRQALTQLLQGGEK